MTGQEWQAKSNKSRVTSQVPFVGCGNPPEAARRKIRKYIKEGTYFSKTEHPWSSSLKIMVSYHPVIIQKNSLRYPLNFHTNLYFGPRNVWSQQFSGPTKFYKLFLVPNKFPTWPVLSGLEVKCFKFTWTVLTGFDQSWLFLTCPNLTCADVSSPYLTWPVLTWPVPTLLVLNCSVLTGPAP